MVNFHLIEFCKYFQSINKKFVSVLLLNGKKINILCNALTVTTKQIFEAIIRSENILENYFLGLCALLGGDFVFLPPDLKIYKIAPQMWTTASNKKNQTDVEAESCMFSLFLRIKFFLPTLRGIR